MTLSLDQNSFFLVKLLVLCCLFKIKGQFKLILLTERVY